MCKREIDMGNPNITWQRVELVAKLKAKDINVSKAFCTALVAYWEKKLKGDKYGKK